MTDNKIATGQYLSQLQNALERYRVPRVREILTDLNCHIAEATSSGKSISEVFASLGSTDQLARAYAIELLVDTPTSTRGAATVRFLKMLGIVIPGSVISLCIVSPLGIGGISLLLAGPLLVIGGVLQAMGEHPWWIHTGSLSPLTVVAIGPLTSGIGWCLCWVLWLYVRMAARTLRKALPIGNSLSKAA